jgi:serine/threonine protein kinase
MNASPVRLGRYQPVFRLGQGPLVETIRARAEQRADGSGPGDFTLKVLRAASGRSDLQERFIAAMRSLQWTAMVGTTRVVEIAEGPGPIFAAFEFVEGVDLRQLRGQAATVDGIMDGRLVGLLGRKLAERLGPLHAQSDGPRVHGNLSPGNVLVEPNGDLRLLDCGLAEALRTKDQWASESWHYLSPEQLRGEPATQASDFYALGSLMHFLCCGRPPFEADTPSALEARIAQGPPAIEGMHPAIASIVARLLSHAPADRFRSTTEIVRRLSVALLSANAGVGTSVSTASPAREPAAEPEASNPGTSRGAFEAFSLEADDEQEDPGAPDGPTDAGSDKPAGGRPFAFAAPIADGHTSAAAGAIEADDPDVGVVYDDDDEEDEIEVGPDGKVKRKRRRRAIRLLYWTKSEFARKLFRYAWIPAMVAALALSVEGFFFFKSWRAAREQSRLKDAAMASERARLEAVKPKLPAAPEVPPGHLVLKVSPGGAVVWLDGREVGTTPSTILTEPGAHRLVITATGYRMLRDVVDTSNGAVFEREMISAAFPSSGSVGLNVGCATEGKYPVFVDGREIGALCPIAGIRLNPGKHLIGLFVIPQNRLWTFDREIVADRPHRVQFSY